MTAAGRLLLPLALAGAAWAADSNLQPLIMPGTSCAELREGPLRILVPRSQVEALRPLAGKAAALYAHLARDAGVEASPLTLVFSDELDDHNGFSTVVPADAVWIVLAPAPPRSGIFDGSDHLLRTLAHELAHHLSNTAERSTGVRRVLQAVTGRTMPGDPLSMLWAWATIPSHATQPSFWHEGLAQWVETAYADPASPWAGRGRDSLTHMVWRLHAAAGAIPPPGDWRPGYQHWPYGSMPYSYGLAYTRWLEAAYGARASVWNLVDAQADQAPFFFDAGAEGPLGRPHRELLERARADLLAEQQGILARLRSRPLTAARRLTPEDSIFGAPAWTADRRLAAVHLDPYGIDRVAVVDADGGIERSGLRATRGGEVRSLPDGSFIYADTAAALPDGWPGAQPGCCKDSNEVFLFTRSRIALVDAAGRSRLLEGRRMLQPDLRRDGTGWQVAAVRLGRAGSQELVRCAVPLDGPQGAWAAIPVQGRAWSPAWRPGSGELAWVETWEGGSRLVLAHPDRPQQHTLLAEVRGRLLHPCWQPDGAGLFVCADHSGVANAYWLAVAEPGRLVAVTNTVGGVLACVPSPDGGELALLDHDARGPFLARIPNRREAWPGEVERIELAWPAPVAADPAPIPLQAAVKRPSAAPADPPPSTAPATDYHGLPAIRPLYATPTTRVTERGGWGVAAVAADPLNTHQVVGAVGVGNVERSGVGFASYTCSPFVLQGQALAWRDERSYADRLWDRWGRTYDYTENTAGAELRLGQGLAGISRRVFGYLAGGFSRATTVSSSEARWAGVPAISGDTPFIGTERYLEAVVGFASGTTFPTSYAREDGSRIALSYRHSGLGGDLEGDRLMAAGSYVLSVWPEAGHQLVAGGVVGWSAQPVSYLQGRFQVGGSSGLDLPRGYGSTVAAGDQLLGWTAAYRLPVWRPWAGIGTTPFSLRQVVLEGFVEGAKASPDRPGGRGDWYRSAGAELRLNLEIWAVRSNPGLGWARQLDGAEDDAVYFTLEYTR